MSYSADVTVRTVYGQFLTVDGTPASGTVTFSASHKIEDDQDAIILSAPIRLTLDGTGSFSVDLPTTDNRKLSPIGWYYTARIRVNGSKAYSFDFYLPAGDMSDVDITSIDTVSQSVSSQAAVNVPRGPVGPQGLQGPAGIQGPAGPAGGPQGIQGAQGAQGIAGSSGIQGAQGLQGESGVGIQGASGAQGIQGATGSTGAQGIQGPAGEGITLQQLSDAIAASALDSTDDLAEGVTNLYFTPTRVGYTHTQTTPSTEWVISHDLGFYPNITVQDLDGNIYEGEISYTTENIVTLTFYSPITGIAYLS